MKSEGLRLAVSFVQSIGGAMTQHLGRGRYLLFKREAGNGALFEGILVEIVDCRDGHPSIDSFMGAKRFECDCWSKGVPRVRWWMKVALQPLGRSLRLPK
jgi:hypothetical protein